MLGSWKEKGNGRKGEVEAVHVWRVVRPEEVGPCQERTCTSASIVALPTITKYSLAIHGQMNR